jgi:hypothetical protein
MFILKIIDVRIRIHVNIHFTCYQNGRKLHVNIQNAEGLQFLLIYAIDEAMHLKADIQQLNKKKAFYEAFK